jgi:hypothetical protein
MTEEDWAGRKRRMVDVTVEGLIHSEHESGHGCSSIHAAMSAWLITGTTEQDGAFRQSGVDFCAGGWMDMKDG